MTLSTLPKTNVYRQVATTKKKREQRVKSMLPKNDDKNLKARLLLLLLLPSFHEQTWVSASPLSLYLLFLSLPSVNERGRGRGTDDDVSQSQQLIVEFSFRELKLAAKCFKKKTLLHEGAAGGVYKGWLNGTLVAIKRMKLDGFKFFDPFPIWQKEVYFLRRLSHPNLVKLLGYCWDEDELLLVYEFMRKGSLMNHLFEKNPTVLDWNSRIKIMIDAARGLSFLHNCEKPVIYRNFKSSKILLDENYNAKISNLGFAKLGPSKDESHVSTSFRGTFGYIDPESYTTGHVNVKSDVYSFGVVLLELLTVMRPFDPNRPIGQMNLAFWVRPYIEDKKLKTIMDARIEGQYSLEAASQVAQLALKCLEYYPKDRPSMADVVEALEAIQAIQQPQCKVCSSPSASTAAAQLCSA